ncbi:hypothetical protein Q4512_14755 [Oceanihabitans sp. 2_MG-2023]|uniref:hypothetical protein n=1 Tax=Oceanihabitans sp. 2_MG-2023 TaxID=3062661 RepID=UPI0026E40AE3|nr:hypothetical protein [Oceanihabitans sp. 2_MG-2023]MDO6598181.1 hypothetical protein [Oceanihabitans sp. 2_MG-2023]
MKNDKKDELIIQHEEFGEELFHIENAKYNLYEVEKNRWEFVIYIETDFAIKRSKELEKVVHAEPTIEVTAILNSAEPKLTEKMIIPQKSGYDYSRDEYLSNIYYFSHETVEDFRIEILEIKANSIIAKMDGKCVINGSNGLEPDSKISTTTEFIIDKNFKRTTE